LKLEYDEPLSNFAFNFNLRHYHMGLIMGDKPGKSKVPLGGIKQKKGGLFTAQKSQAFMEAGA
jgi:hypothetical protein